MRTILRGARALAAGLLLLCALDARAVAFERALVNGLAADDNDAKVAAIRALAASGDARAATILRALSEDRLATTDGGKRVLLMQGDKLHDAYDDSVVRAGTSEPIVLNNRLRTALESALALVDLAVPDRARRLAAAQSLQASEDDALAQPLAQAAERERDVEIKSILTLASAALALRSSDPEQRIKAASALASANDSGVRSRLAALTTVAGEPDERVRNAAEYSLRQINARLRKTEVALSVFSGLSLGSILLLAALGLAITYGLMGIINMAHGEFLMIGAYTTYVVQVMFRSYAPRHFDWYVVAAVPAAFVVTALIGMLLEATVLRRLYGRPLETLLTTWGVSLLLIQSARSLFGAQNVEVENPSWLAGGFALDGGYVLPLNRLVIIGFAFVVLAGVWLLINRTRLGLFVRAVTQNRPMAACAGVPIERVDRLTFGLGSGVAGLAGVALSQIGNVGPDLGQSYIVDSFMVVVLGGVGQLAGTVIAALGLGSMAKFLEPFSGAVMAKIFVLLFIILFIQKRPQGLFALKGRSVEA